MGDAIKKALMYFQLALGIVPQIVELVKAIELPGNGSAKLATVIDIIKAAYELIPDDVKQVIGAAKIEAFVAKVVPILVSLLNLAGVFGKK